MFLWEISLTFLRRKILFKKFEKIFLSISLDVKFKAFILLNFEIISCMLKIK